MNDVVIVAALRTPVGKFGGTLAKLSASELGARVIKALLANTGVKPEWVSEVILGQVLTAGCGQNPARAGCHRRGTAGGGARRHDWPGVRQWAQSCAAGGTGHTLWRCRDRDRRRTRKHERLGSRAQRIP